MYNLEISWSHYLISGLGEFHTTDEEQMETMSNPPKDLCKWMLNQGVRSCDENSK